MNTKDAFIQFLVPCNFPCCYDVVDAGANSLNTAVETTNTAVAAADAASAADAAAVATVSAAAVD